MRITNSFLIIACRLIVGLGLVYVLIPFIHLRANAHITMCMITALGYAIGFLFPDTKWAARISSLFFSGIIFYTTYTATTWIYFDKLVIRGILPSDLNSVWRYHTFINVALLFLFWTNLDRMKFVTAGMWLAMMAAPLMFFMKMNTFDSEIAIWSYFFAGIILFFIDRFYLTSAHLQKIRKWIIYSLWAYVLLSMIPVLGYVLRHV